MKNDNRLLKICFTLILCCVICGGLHAMGLELTVGMGNLVFDDSSKESLDTGIFEPDNNFLGSLGITDIHADIADFRVWLERDPLLRTRMIGIAGFSFNYGRIEMGPFLGLFNQNGQPFSTGGMGSIQFMYPGVFYINAKGSSTFALPGEYIQNEGEAGIGFWVPNVVCALSMYTGNFSYMQNSALQISDKKVRYQFSADVHSKNVPYTIKIDMGYEELSRTYRLWDDEGVTKKTNEVKSFFAGFTGTWRLNQQLSMVLGLEMPLYFWTVEPVRKPDASKVFFQAKAGIIWTFPEREKRLPEGENEEL